MTSEEVAQLVAWIAAGGVALGAFIAGLFQLFHALIGGGIAKRQWRRQERHRAYLAFLQLMDRHNSHAMSGNGPKTAKQVKEALEELVDAVSAVSLVGPERVLERARAIRDAVGETISTHKEHAEFAARRVAYVKAARSALGGLLD